MYAPQASARTWWWRIWRLDEVNQFQCEGWVNGPCISLSSYCTKHQTRIYSRFRTIEEKIWSCSSSIPYSYAALCSSVKLTSFVQGGISGLECCSLTHDRHTVRTSSDFYALSNLVDQCMRPLSDWFRTWNVLKYEQLTRSTFALAGFSFEWFHI